jgi:hypothetical protein
VVLARGRVSGGEEADVEEEGEGKAEKEEEFSTTREEGRRRRRREFVEGDLNRAHSVVRRPAWWPD